MAKSILKALRKYTDGLILFVFPIILLCINNNWIFTPVTNYMPDPWFYFAYFRYFYSYTPVYPSNTHYFVERLTWNVPGYYINKIFPPLQANYAIHLIVYYIGIFSLYGILYLLFNRRTAYITALLMGSYPWFLRSAGWDYTDGTGISHMLLLILLITLALYSSHWKIYLVLAGIVHASLLITNPFWVGFFPSWGIYFLLLNHQIKKFNFEKLILAAAYFITGNLITVGLCGFFYYSVTGDYFFMAQSLRSSISLTHDAVNKNSVITNYGHIRPFWHALPMVIALASTWKLWISRRDKNSFYLIPFYFLFMLGYGWLIFWNFYSVPFLIVFPYSSFAIPSIFLLLGALIHTFPPEFSERQFQVFSIASVALLIIPFIMIDIFPLSENLQGNFNLILILSILLLVILLIPKQKPPIIIVVLTISILFYLVGENAYVYVANRSKGQDNFMAIISASQSIDSHFPNHKYNDFRLWFRADENYDTFFSLAALYLYPWGSAIGNPYSKKEQTNVFAINNNESVQDGDNIVIISSNRDSNTILAEANNTLFNRNAKLTLKSSEFIQQGSLHFYLYFTKLSTFQ